MVSKRLKKTTNSKEEVRDWQRHWSVVETDNFGSDCPDESFVIRHLRKGTAKSIADLINKDRFEYTEGSRYHTVVKDSYKEPYKLKPGFEP